MIKSSFKTSYASIYARIAFCILAAGVFLYLYISELNQLTSLRLLIPSLLKEVKDIYDENTEIRYEMERFESPIHLMELLQKPEFGHLHYPYVKDVVILKNGNRKGFKDNGK
ncbi:MAG TPA: hypothetical protein PLC42_05540 [Parachlamydiaceae bacterium]|nr:hypothetical protein [Parachlamydiaceae bacterium]